MGKIDELKSVISTAFGREEPDMVFTNCKVLNVFTNEIEDKDVAVRSGIIAGVGRYADSAGEKTEVIDLGGATICPGLIDSHIHIESSMLTPPEFAKAVIPHGTTAVVTDPHEIANVAGINGIEYMMEQSSGLPMDVFFMLPSCVPATPLDESGAELDAADLEPLFKRGNVMGLAELMNAFGTVRNDSGIINKIMAAKNAGKVIDGHAPRLYGRELNAYVAAGVGSDHECYESTEAIEKLRLGQWIMVREGTAAKNLENMMPLFDERYYGRCLLVTDDKHPGDLLEKGHIDYIIRKAISLGADPAKAIRMATLNAAQCFGIGGKGAVAPGYRADIIVVDSIERFNVLATYYNGRITSRNGKLVDAGSDCFTTKTRMHERYGRVYNSFNLRELTEADFTINGDGVNRRVIGLIKGQILTEEIITASDTSDDRKNDIIKLAVIERHKDTGHIGLGYLKGYGLKNGAVASSIAHDSHNLIVVGTNDRDMAVAANAVNVSGGGLAIVCDGEVLGQLALPVGGIMCEKSAESVEDALKTLKAIAAELGVAKGIDPFMTLAFSSLSVIPKLKLTTFGLVDVESQQIVPVIFGDGEKCDRGADED